MRLLQGLLRTGFTGDAAWRAPLAICLALAAQQPGCRPRLFRAAPFNPGQARAIGAQGWRGVKVGAFGQDFTAALGDGHQAMLDRPRTMAFFHRQHMPVGPAQIAVAPHALGQRLR
ncbi:hypothetical protein D3C76_1128130 [compost metagenome]